jgi:hypothetical protein
MGTFLKSADAIVHPDKPLVPNITQDKFIRAKAALFQAVYPLVCAPS